MTSHKELSPEDRELRDVFAHTCASLYYIDFAKAAIDSQSAGLEEEEGTRVEVVDIGDANAAGSRFVYGAHRPNDDLELHIPMFDMDLGGVRAVRTGDPDVIDLILPGVHRDNSDLEALVTATRRAGILDDRRTIETPGLSIVVPLYRCPVLLFDSSTPGHQHMVFDRLFYWEDFRAIMAAFHRIGLIEDGYLRLAETRGQAFLRLPGEKKVRPEEEGCFAPDDGEPF